MSGETDRRTEELRVADAAPSGEAEAGSVAQASQGSGTVAAAAVAIEQGAEPLSAARRARDSRPKGAGLPPG